MSGGNAVLHNGASVSGGALVLDGVDDYAELPVSSTLRVLTDVSVEMWVTWTGARSWQPCQISQSRNTFHNRHGARYHDLTMRWALLLQGELPDHLSLSGLQTSR
jgi:hypothetical protein